MRNHRQIDETIGKKSRRGEERSRSKTERVARILRLTNITMNRTAEVDWQADWQPNKSCGAEWRINDYPTVLRSQEAGRSMRDFLLITHKREKEMISTTLLDSSLGGWATPGGAVDIIVVVGRTYVGVVRPTGIVCTHYQMPGNLVVRM